MNEISKFSVNQKKAILHKEGPMMVVSGPGSGKTTVIANRVKKLVQNNVLENDILVITFTKNSADDMTQRYLNLVDSSYTKVTFCTFHKFFYLILRSLPKYSDIKLLYDNEKNNCIKKIFKKLKVTADDEVLNNFESEVTLLKSKASKNNEILIDFFSNRSFASVYEEYEKFKKENNYIDFDDMIYLAYYELLENQNLLEFWKQRFEYVLIDEFQDINEIQYKAIKLILQNDNFFVVGDDDQSIYSFRGSSPRFLIQFKKDFENVKEVHLDINYRSTEQIISLTNVIIKENVERLEKDIKGVGRKGKNPVILSSKNPIEESRFIAKKIQSLREEGCDYEDIAVLFRTNIQARSIVDALIDYNIPFVVKDGFLSIHKHFIFKDFVNYINFAKDNSNVLCGKAIINKPNRYISRTLVDEMSKHSGSIVDNIIHKSNLPEWRLEKINELKFHIKALENKNPFDAFKYFCNVIDYEEYLIEYATQRKTKVSEYFDVLEELKDEMKRFETFEEYFKYVEDIEEQMIKNKNNIKGVLLSTLHSSKGLEFDTVFIASVVDGIIPYEKSVSENNLEEERRLFYVGLTRAKNNLFISTVLEKNEKKTEVSSFLKKLIKK